MKKCIFLLSMLIGLFAAAQDTTTFARINYNPVAIVINIPNVVVNTTTLKRTATLFTMTYNQQSQSLSLNWTIKFYADSLGSYGAYLGNVIPNYSKEIIANNTVFVNPKTGAILLPDINGKYLMPYLGQYDFFNMLAENQPLKVHDMIRLYGQQVLNWDK